MELAKRIQELRRKRGLSTAELAMRAEVSSGFISQLEHQRNNPSLHTLQRVATALQVPLTYLLLDEALGPQVVRKHERHRIQLDRPGLCAALLTPLPQQHLDVVLLDIPPGPMSWPHGRSHAGQECHVVPKGTIRAHYGEDLYVLEEGDSLTWDGSVPHRMENIGIEPAQLLIVLAPAAFLQDFTGGPSGASVPQAQTATVPSVSGEEPTYV